MTEQWTETIRRLVPRSVQIQSASGPGTFAYADMELEIAEVRIEGGKRTGFRIRSERTSPIYLHEHGELTLAFAVAIPALREIENVCMKLAKEEEKRIDR